MEDNEPSGESGVGGKYDNLGYACARLDCTQPVPFDMVAVAIDSDVYCSPGCARVALDAVRGCPNEVPGEVTLLDPQNYADKSDLPGVDETEMVLTRRVVGLPDAKLAVDEIEEIFPLRFRAVGGGE